MVALQERDWIAGQCGHEQGIYVLLRSFPSKVVFVSDAEIDQALERNPGTKYARPRHIVAQNIAIGKRCGAYELGA